MSRVTSALALTGAVFLFANAAQATAITVQSTVSFTESVAALDFASSGLNTTLIVGTPDVIAQFITVTVAHPGAWSAVGSPLSANFNFTLPTPVGATTDSGLITGAQINGRSANGTLAITWPSQPIEFDFTDGTKLMVTLGNLNFTCSPQGNNCLDGQDPFYISGTFLATQGPTTARDPEIARVPEPGTLALFGSGAAALALLRRRRKSKQAA